MAWLGERLREVRGREEKQAGASQLQQALDLVRAHKLQEALNLLARAS